MSLESFPDWKKIGKRIGKKLRDILDPPDPGLSREELLDRRLRNSLRGLAYFDTFDEIKQWTPENVDAVHQGNIRLLERSSTHVSNPTGPTARLLLCHDYSGGYHDYESSRPLPLKKPMYSCHYLQYVETFVYFSHKLVCIPPAPWINTMHRNGVKILGTFMVEGEDSGIQHILDRVDGEFIVAKQLAEMAENYGFDGWLLNIESEFPDARANPVQDLAAFIRSLKRRLEPSGMVIWYDALTKDNEVEYQNALNQNNVRLAMAADAIFTNYKWSDKKMLETKATANAHGIKPIEIYFGIDVWAQNTDMPGPPRVTYPRNGGGGTLTGVAVRTLATHGFSAAIFAPAWPYEHFPRCLSNGRRQAEAVEQSMWEGTALPNDLDCDCKKRKPHHWELMKTNSICKSAHEYPAGSNCFFETNFQEPLIPERRQSSSDYHIKTHARPPTPELPQHPVEGFRSMLGSQAILPSVAPHAVRPETDLTIQGRADSWMGLPSYLLGFNAQLHASGDYHSIDIPGYNQDTSTSGRTPYRFRLFYVNLNANRDLEAAICFRLQTQVQSSSIGFYAKRECSTLGRSEYQDQPITDCEMHTEHVMTFDMIGTAKTNRIVEIGVFFKSLDKIAEQPEILRLFSVYVKPKEKLANDWKICDIQTIQRSAGPYSEKRLKWSWKGAREAWPNTLPWSDITGPFSAFTISLGERTLGLAHCLEFPFRPGDFEDQGEHIEVAVRGHRYGGGPASISRITLKKTDVLE